MKTTSEKVYRLRCAASFVIAAYGKERLIPQALRALPLELFAKPFQIGSFADLLRIYP